MTKWAVTAAVAMLLAGGTARASLSVVVPDPTTAQSLQTSGGLLDNLYGLNNLQRIDDYDALMTDKLWFNLGTVNALVKANYSAFDATFGYIPGAGDHTSASMEAAYQSAVTGISAGTTGQTGSFTVAQTGDVFRFGINFSNLPDGPTTWSSYDPENPDGNMHNDDHLVTYAIVGNAGGFTSNNIGGYVLAWEDTARLGDQYYNDVVVEISGATPVPEPLSGLFLGFAGLALVIKRRRKS